MSTAPDIAARQEARDSAAPPLLELRGISKRFGELAANRDIDLVLRAGEVLGVLGENGAGKSTLMNVLSGLLQPDSGTIHVAGNEVHFTTPRAAHLAGIGMVHQHFLLVPALSVAENVALGEPAEQPWALPIDRVRRKLAALGADLGLPVDPAARVEALDVGSRQRVEILKALYRGARVLILDEPTTVLTEAERELLYATIRRLKASGIAVILISHKLDDVYAVCDRVMVLRGGAVVDEAPLAERTPEALVRAMIGEEPPARAVVDANAPGAPLLEVEHLSVRRDGGSLAFSDVSFALRRGEILALAGVEGNGQRELAEAIAGLRALAGGTIRFDGKLLGNRSTTRRRRALGVRYVPDDRGENGMLAQRALAENFLLSHWFQRRFGRLGVLRRRPARAAVREIGSSYRVRLPPRGGPIAALSGGNQQKLIVGRELWGAPRLLIAAHPTRGLDVRTVEFVQQRLRESRAAGVAVLLISADLAEIWQVADRVMVLAQGRLRGPVALGETSVQQVGAWISGR
jgi:simple sugar transport system ATP-binding protein